jgi:hypothetical protein
MAGLTGTFNPAEVQLQIDGALISGFGDGTFITVAKDDNELWSVHTGAHGEVSRTRKNKPYGTITFTLKRTSPSHAALNTLKFSGAVFIASVKDSSTNYFASAQQAWIMNDPDDEFAEEEAMVEWIVGCADLRKAQLGA